jgi:amino acid transporter
MIALALVIIYYKEKALAFRLKRSEWFLVIAGCFLVITSFVWDYIKYASQSEHKFWIPNSSQDLFMEIKNYVPQEFNWTLFWIGEIMIILGLVLLLIRLRKIR